VWQSAARVLNLNVSKKPEKKKNGRVPTQFYVPPTGGGGQMRKYAGGILKTRIKADLGPEKRPIGC